ncbi:hypothetical protein F373_gp064 [Bacillus phage SP-10]|uniref:hypothetical protein n=1 Tax=Bacillus phage SP10 TaxID=941058 RepID=UPI0002198B14|nr:hypothetical protein F373_gp064 [Bacillus phage SP-10]BAK52876.1 hypothetical protein [Bacillus phage SP-10]
MEQIIAKSGNFTYLLREDARGTYSISIRDARGKETFLRGGYSDSSEAINMVKEAIEKHKHAKEARVKFKGVDFRLIPDSTLIEEIYYGGQYLGDIVTVKNKFCVVPSRFVESYKNTFAFKEDAVKELLRLYGHPVVKE